MTALAEDRNTQMRDGILAVHPVKGSTKIYAGSIVALDASGYAVPAADTSGLKVAGRAEEQVDNSSGADGDLTVKVRKGVFKYAASGLTDADVGKPAFVSDDQTISVAATTNNICAGIIVDVESATEAWVAVGDVGERAGAAQADEAQADAATQTGSYVQADVQSIADLANALKTAHNNLLAKLRAARIIGS